jgi:hypothetical protein
LFFRGRVTILRRVRRDPRFREALLKEGIQCLLAGDMDMGKAILRDYIKATMGFAELSNLKRNPPKASTHRFSSSMKR